MSAILWLTCGIILACIIWYVLPNLHLYKESFMTELNSPTLQAEIRYTYTRAFTIEKRDDEIDNQLELLVARRPSISLVNSNTKAKPASSIYTDVLRVHNQSFRDRYPLITIMKSPRQLFFLCNPKSSSSKSKSKSKSYTTTSVLPMSTRIGFVHAEEKILGQLVIPDKTTVWVQMSSYKDLVDDMTINKRTDIVCVLLNEESPIWDLLLKATFKWITNEDVNMSLIKDVLPFAYISMHTISTNLRNPKVPSPPKSQTGNVINIDTCLISLEPSPEYDRTISDILSVANQSTRNNEYSRFFMFMDIALDDMRSYNDSISPMIESFAMISPKREDMLSYKGKIVLESKKHVAKPNFYEYTLPAFNKDWGVKMQPGDRLWNTSVKNGESNMAYLYVNKQDTISDTVTVANFIVWPVHPAFKGIWYQYDTFYDATQKKLGIFSGDSIRWSMVPINWDIIDGDTIAKFDARFRCVDDPIIKNSHICPNNSWDRPCEVDEECPFFQSGNPALRGGCKDGYCEMPIGVSRVGYRKYTTNSSIVKPIFELQNNNLTL